MDGLDGLTNQVIAYIGLMVIVISAYRDAFGASQSYMTDAVIKAFGIKSKYKMAANVATGVVLATALGLVLALFTTWIVVPLAAIVGLFAAARAAEVHDEKKLVEKAMTPPMVIDTEAPKKHYNYYLDRYPR